MDYDHFYRYLARRPQDEIRNCLMNVTKLARKLNVSVDSSDASTNTEDSSPSGAVSSQLHQLQVSQRVWIHQAVCAKFGSVPIDDLTPTELLSVAAELLTTTEAAEYVVKINNDIKVEADHSVKQGSSKIPKCENSETDTSRNAPSVPSTCISPTKKTKVEDDQYQYDSSDGESSTEISNKEEVASSPHNLRPSSSKKRQRKMYDSRQYWSASKDKELVAAVTEYKHEGWDVVIEHLTFSANIRQCRTRWYDHLEPVQMGLRDDCQWTDAEVAELKKVAGKYDYRIEWKAVGMKLGRAPAKCAQKWRSLH